MASGVQILKGLMEPSCPEEFCCSRNASLVWDLLTAEAIGVQSAHDPEVVSGGWVQAGHGQATEALVQVERRASFLFLATGRSCWFLWSADGFHCDRTRPTQLIHSEEAVKVLPLSSQLLISFRFVFNGLFEVSSAGPFCSPSKELVPHRLQTGHTDLTGAKCRWARRLHPPGQAR